MELFQLTLQWWNRRIKTASPNEQIDGSVFRGVHTQRAHAHSTLFVNFTFVNESHLTDIQTRGRVNTASSLAYHCQIFRRASCIFTEYLNWLSRLKSADNIDLKDRKKGGRWWNERIKDKFVANVVKTHSVFGYCELNSLVRSKSSIFCIFRRRNFISRHVEYVHM